MAVSHWDPLRELVQLQQRMNRLFDATLSRSSGDEQHDLAAGSWSPPADIFETADRLVLQIDLPGLSQDEVDIRVENASLVLRGERRHDAAVQREDFLRVERPAGAFTRTFSLPPGVDQSGIRAVYRDGVLEIILPKKSETKAHTIRVES